MTLGSSGAVMAGANQSDRGSGPRFPADGRATDSESGLARTSSRTGPPRGVRWTRERFTIAPNPGVVTGAGYLAVLQFSGVREPMARTGGGQSKKRAAAEARREAAKRKQRNRRFFIAGGVAIVAAVAVVFAITRPAPVELAGVQTFADQGRTHLATGAPAPAYNSDPPTSGPHSSQSVPCGIYRQEIPGPAQVHDLEHGVVMVQYSPEIDSSTREQLEGFGREAGSHVIVAPRSGMDEPVVLTAWTKRLGLETADEGLMRSFYDRYAKAGPELGVPCPNQVDEAAS